MKPDLNEFDDIVRRHLPSAPAEDMATDAARVLQRLRSMASQAVDPVEDEDDGFGDLEPASGSHLPWVAMVGAVAAVLVAAIATTVERRHAAESAGVATVDGAVYLESGKPIRSNDRDAMLALPDGSRVEMQSQSELSLERADDGLRIRLKTGSIIVNAAKQPRGHLYVQTRDMTVSVVGTIFLVNAEEAGSRVAVIEGEVRVREPEKKIETRLRPGEQVSTSPTLAARPVKEEIAWSRHADAHLAILAAFEKGMAATAGPLTRVAETSPAASPAAGQAGAAAGRQEFEEASIRPCDPNNVSPAPEGARGGGPNSFQMTPGRTHALCMTLATIIRTAYNYGPAALDFLTGGGQGIGPDRRGLAFNNVYGLGVEDGVRVRGGPDWVRSERYTIDAVGDAAATAETMRGPMLRALLERRFQLKTHIESEQIPAFALTVAKGGLKMKEGTCTPPDASLVPLRSTTEMVRRNLDAARRGATTTAPCGFAGTGNGPNMLFVGAGASIPQLGFILGAPVIDRTGIPNTVRFNYVLEYAPDESTAAGPVGRGLPAGLQLANEPSDVPRAPNIFTALEDQLGLKLEPAKAPREFLVIDRVERPTPN